MLTAPSTSASFAALLTSVRPPVPVRLPLKARVSLLGLPRVNVAGPLRVIPTLNCVALLLLALSVMKAPLWRPRLQPPASTVLLCGAPGLKVMELSVRLISHFWNLCCPPATTTSSPLLGTGPAPLFQHAATDHSPVPHPWAGWPVQVTVAAKTAHVATAANSTKSSPAAASMRRRLRPINDLTPPRACVLSS